MAKWRGPWRRAGGDYQTVGDYGEVIKSVAVLRTVSDEQREDVRSTPVKIENGTYGADDFTEYARKIPGRFTRMGVTPQNFCLGPIEIKFFHLEKGSYFDPKPRIGSAM